MLTNNLIKGIALGIVLASSMSLVSAMRTEAGSDTKKASGSVGAGPTAMEVDGDGKSSDGKLSISYKRCRTGVKEGQDVFGQVIDGGTFCLSLNERVLALKNAKIDNEAIVRKVAEEIEQLKDKEDKDGKLFDVNNIRYVRIENCNGIHVPVLGETVLRRVVPKAVDDYCPEKDIARLMASILLKVGAVPTYERGVWAELYNAILNRDEALALALMEADVEEAFLNWSDDDTPSGANLLYYAASKGLSKVIEKMCRAAFRKACPNFVNHVSKAMQMTALNIAILHKHNEAEKILRSFRAQTAVETLKK